MQQKYFHALIPAANPGPDLARSRAGDDAADGVHRDPGGEGFRRVHFTEWGASDNPRVVACAHGLTRNARDFDLLAQALASDYRVACIDFPGRGASDWLGDSRNYTVECYTGVAAAWLAALGGEQVHWLGTSMGGLVGIALAAAPRVPLVSMIVNDVGPEVPAQAMGRIADYVGLEHRFASLAEVEAHLRVVHAPFGPLSDAQWTHLARHSARKADDGSLRFHYDPAIAHAFAAASDTGVDMWAEWRAGRLPTLLLQGADSDVLPAAVAERMLAARPECTLHSFAGIGHAPALMEADQIALVRDWLGCH